MRLILTTWLFIWACSATLAGPWPRKEGELFIAAGGNFLLSEGARLPVHYDPTLYAEFGASERVTLGLDLHTADAGRIGSLFLFASFPIGDLAAQNKFSANLALGVRADAYAKPETLLRGGISWGRGLEAGWLAIDFTATYGSSDSTFRPKVDGTWGYHLNDKWSTIMQLQTGQGFTNDFYAKVAPSIVYNFSDKVKIHLGTVHGFTGDRGSAAKLEAWLTF